MEPLKYQANIAGWEADSIEPDQMACLSEYLGYIWAVPCRNEQMWTAKAQISLSICAVW